MIAKSMNSPQRAVVLLALFLMVLAAAFGSSMLSATAANAAPLSLSQCDGTDNVGGQNVQCSYSIVNNLDQATGLASSSVTLTECHGAANAVPTCTTNTTTNATDLVLAVDQCNTSGNGGGGTVICSVDVTNNVVGDATVAPASINQCNGSGQGGGTEPTVVCDPIGVTTDATIDQCNGSGNGGGGTERVKCTVDTASTETSAIPVKITQCNGSGNGDGAYVTCFTAIRSIVTAVEGPGDNPGDGGGEGPGTDNPGGGGGTPGTETPGGTPPGGTPPSGTPPGGTPPGGGGNGTPPGATTLPNTGVDSAPLLIGGGGLFLLGTALVLLRKFQIHS